MSLDFNPEYDDALGTRRRGRDLRPPPSALEGNAFGGGDIGMTHSAGDIEQGRVLGKDDADTEEEPGWFQSILDTLSGAGLDDLHGQSGGLSGGALRYKPPDDDEDTPQPETEFAKPTEVEEQYTDTRHQRTNTEFCPTGEEKSMTPYLKMRGALAKHFHRHTKVATSPIYGFVMY